MFEQEHSKLVLERNMLKLELRDIRHSWVPELNDMNYIRHSWVLELNDMNYIRHSWALEQR